MKTRKLVLIIADVVLLAVCIIQWCVRAHDGAKYFKISETPDEYTVVTPAENIHYICTEFCRCSRKYPCFRQSCYSKRSYKY